jgi:hypothetical protein
MKRILVTLLTVISISSVFTQKDKRLKGLEKELNDILEATQAPGFAVAIIEIVLIQPNGRFKATRK